MSGRLFAGFFRVALEKPDGDSLVDGHIGMRQRIVHRRADIPLGGKARRVAGGDAARLLDRPDGDTLDPFALRKDKSYVFSGDMNGDSASGNDLIYIPRSTSEMRTSAASALP